jgi:hypothetical protein
VSAEHPSFVTVSKGGARWFAVMMWWAPEDGGFWEPWNTGIGRYPTEEEAEEEGKEWAESEGMEFRKEMPR